MVDLGDAKEERKGTDKGDQFEDNQTVYYRP
jgi:hypothetical protein